MRELRQECLLERHLTVRSHGVDDAVTVCQQLPRCAHPLACNEDGAEVSDLETNRQPHVCSRLDRTQTNMQRRLMGTRHVYAQASRAATTPPSSGRPMRSRLGQL